MGGHYEKGLFNQLMEVQERLEAMEEAHKKERKEAQSLTKEVKHLREEKSDAADGTDGGQGRKSSVTGGKRGIAERERLRQNNERMKRILSNNSSNSSLAPSGDAGRGKPVNTYNSRRKTEKRREARADIPANISRARKWNARFGKGVTNIA